MQPRLCYLRSMARKRRRSQNRELRMKRGEIDLEASGAGPIAQKIRAMLRERGISQQAMQKWWNGKSSPKLATRMAIARALGVPLSELLDEQAEKEKAESDKTIEQYIASDMGCDLDDGQRAQLRLSIAWIDSDHPMQPREVHAAAELIRLRFRGPERGGLQPLNPRGSSKGKRIKR